MFSLLRFFYSLLIYLSLPLVLLRMAYKSIQQPDYAKRWAERLGFYAAITPPAQDTLTSQAQRQLIWLHACSVGEAESIISLVHCLLEQYPDYQLLVTTTTPTGSNRVCQEFAGKVAHVYLPFDTPAAIKRFIAHFQPVAGLITEKEIWPNLLLGCAEKNIPVLLISACVSARSCRRYQQMKVLFQPVFQSLAAVAAQTLADQQRFIQCGVRAEKLHITGSLKTDAVISDNLQQQAPQLRQQLFKQRPVWIAGSTHAGEEIILLAAHRQLLNTIPDLVLILAPRHPHRLPEVQGLCQQLSLAFQQRSSGQLCKQADTVFLLDTLGELRLFYGCADLAFVGGSFVPIGGHNLLEPLFWDIPVLFAAHVESCQEIADLLLRHGVAFQVEDQHELALKITQLLTDTVLRQQIAKQASLVIDHTQQGALAQTISLLDNVISIGEH